MLSTRYSRYKCNERRRQEIVVAVGPKIMLKKKTYVITLSLINKCMEWDWIIYFCLVVFRALSSSVRRFSWCDFLWRSLFHAAFSRVFIIKVFCFFWFVLCCFRFFYMKIFQDIINIYELQLSFKIKIGIIPAGSQHTP